MENPVSNRLLVPKNLVGNDLPTLGSGAVKPKNGTVISPLSRDAVNVLPEDRTALKFVGGEGIADDFLELRKSESLCRESLSRHHDSKIRTKVSYLVREPVNGIWPLPSVVISAFHDSEHRS